MNRFSHNLMSDTQLISYDKEIEVFSVCQNVRVANASDLEILLSVVISTYKPLLMPM